MNIPKRCGAICRKREAQKHKFATEVHRQISSLVRALGGRPAARDLLIVFAFCVQVSKNKRQPTITLVNDTIGRGVDGVVIEELAIIHMRALDFLSAEPASWIGVELQLDELERLPVPRDHGGRLVTGATHGR